MDRSFLFSTVFGLALVVATPAARAEEPTSPISAEARAYFSNGVELLQKGNHQDAYNQFLLAYERSGRSWKVLGNLGLCALHLERDGEALLYYRRYLDEGGEGVDPEERTAIEKELLLIEGNLATIVVSSKQTVRSITVTRDGSDAPAQSYRLSTGTLRLGVRAGALHVEAASGDRQLVWDVVLNPGDESTHVFDFDAKADGAVAANAAPGDSWTALRWTGAATLGLGGLSLVGGGIVGAMKLGEESSARESCLEDGPTTVCPESAEAGFSRASDYATIANALFIGGGVLVASGITLFVLGGSEGSRTDAATLSLSPRFGGGSLSLAGRF